MVDVPDLTDPNSGHGHVRPRPDGHVARCGGPRLCKTCRLEVSAIDNAIGGASGVPGPVPGERRPHCYARDPHSGAGNCRCGAALGDNRHTQAAPGVPIPKEMRHAR